MNNYEVITHHRVCHLCEAMCGLVIKRNDSKVLDIRGDKNDPLSRGHICPKAVSLKDIHEDPDRLRQPLKRVRSRPGQYHHEEIDWPGALDLAAKVLGKTIVEKGVDSVGAYFGNPAIHNYGMLTHQRNLFQHIRTRNRFSATSVDQLPHHLVSLWCFGHKFLHPIPDVDRTKYFLMLGANPLASNGSMWTVPDVRRRLKALMARGGKLVVVDPRRTETAALANEHIFIRPGTDAALLLSIIHVLFRDKLVSLGRLSDFTDGLEEVSAIVRSFDPGWAAARTGVSVTEIQRLATEISSAESAVCYGRMGVSTQEFGTLCQWAIQVINVLTGNLDKEGGSLFSLPAVDQILNNSPGGFGRFFSRVKNLPEFDYELPAVTILDEILTPGEAQVRLLITGAGNPVLSTPNGKALDEALEDLDFMISVDPALNETTRHADLIFPPTSPLEHDHYDLAFHNLAVRNTARFNMPVFEKPDGSLHDWEIFAELGERLAKRLDLEPISRIAPDQIIDRFLQAGPYGDRSDVKLNLKKLKENPSGIDLGPLKPQCPDRLQTPTKRIQLAIDHVFKDIDRLLRTRKPDPGVYQLIGRRHVRDNNSWMHNHPRLMRGRSRCKLLIHPDDAALKGWQTGMKVSIESRTGVIEAPIICSDEVMPGVVSLPHGYGHGEPGTRSNVADQYAGVSCNNITDDQFYDLCSGNAAVNGVPVRLSLAQNLNCDSGVENE